MMCFGRVRKKAVASFTHSRMRRIFETKIFRNVDQAQSFVQAAVDFEKNSNPIPSNVENILPTFVLKEAVWY